MTTKQDNHSEQNLSFYQPELPFSCTYGYREDLEVLIIGATHGDEPAGVEASIQYYNHLCENHISVSGRITFALGNPEAYQKKQRYLEADLNRSFANKICQHVSEGRRAQEWRSYLQRHKNRIKGLLDLHCVTSDNSRMAAYSALHPSGKELADTISPLPMHFVYHWKDLNGTLMDEAARVGIPAVGIECGNRANPESMNVALKHISNFLLWYGLIDESDALRTQSPVPDGERRTYETIAAIVPGPQFEFALKELASEIFLPEGQEFAKDSRQVYCAPQDCYLMMPVKTIRESDIDAGFLCRRVENPDVLPKPPL